ncbi:MAG: hypothetical protein N3F03_02935 [Ignavibacteria bacterium]|nr:hypothetical protein [Ignavibacteria bacterium]
MNSNIISEEAFYRRIREIIPSEFSISHEEIGGVKIFKTDFQVGKLLEHTLGFIYIQSKSSMLSAIALQPERNDKILDLCSAPGSKTTLIAELINNKSFILANEISLDRVKALMFNIDRLGILNTTISNNDGIRISNSFKNYFDKILVDPPCTALGDTRFTPQKQIERNISRLENLTQIQYQLLVSAAKMVKVGGEIVYSTCTTTLEENEYLIEKFLSKYPFEIVEPEIPGLKFENLTGKNIREDLFHSVRINPTEDDEGFFIIKLKKKDDFDEEKKSNLHSNDFRADEIHSSNSHKVVDILNQISNNYGIEFDFWKDHLFLLRSGDIYFSSINEFDYSRIKFIRFGIKLATLDKKSGWRLTSNAVQILGRNIQKNILQLENKEQLKTYFLGQKTKINFPDCDFVTVKFGDYFLGSGKVRDNILLSYFPRSRRTIEIDFEFVK